MTKPGRIRYRRQTRALMLASLALLLCIALGVPLLADLLTGFSFLGYPLGYAITGKGILFALVILLFWFARRQNAIDQAQQAAED